MAAFDAAIAAGLGIECDVRLSRDGVAFVFHDAMLDRLTGESGPLAARTAVALDGVTLHDGGAIPRLSMLLAKIGKTTPLLVEIKADGRRVEKMCATVRDDVRDAAGAFVAIMSFNPMVGRWFARYAPDVPRGLVVTQQGKRSIRGRLQRALALCVAKPDFLACDIRHLPSPFASRFRATGRPVLTWTVRSAAQRAMAAVHADQIIFEHADD